MEMVAEVKTLTVHMRCDKCKAGMMKPEHGEIVIPKYFHKCDNCGHFEYYDKMYPYQRFVPIELLREPRENEV